MDLPWNGINENILNVSKVLNDLVDTTEEKDINWIQKESDGTITDITVPNIAKQFTNINVALKEYVDSKSPTSGEDTPSSSEEVSGAVIGGSTFNYLINTNKNIFAGSGWVTHDEKIWTVDTDGDTTSGTLTLGDGIGNNTIRLSSTGNDLKPHIAHVEGITHLVNDTDINVGDTSVHVPTFVTDVNNLPEMSKGDIFNINSDTNLKDALIDPNNIVITGDNADATTVTFNEDGTYTYATESANDSGLSYTLVGPIFGTEEGSPILYNASGVVASDANGGMVLASRVIKDGATYKMWYMLFDNNSLNYMVSDDGDNWSEPIVITGYTPSPYGLDIVKNDNGTYMLWTSTDEGVVTYATSTDGVTWVDQGVISGITDGHVLGRTTVMLDNGTYKMWSMLVIDDEVVGIAYYTSSDGITWTEQGRDTVLLSNYESLFSFTIRKFNNKYYLWYLGVIDNDYGTVCASSVDGITWTYNGALPLPCDMAYTADIISDNGEYRFWYAGSIDGGLDIYGGITGDNLDNVVAGGTWELLPYNTDNYVHGVKYNISFNTNGFIGSLIISDLNNKVINGSIVSGWFYGFNTSSRPLLSIATDGTGGALNISDMSITMESNTLRCKADINDGDKIVGNGNKFTLANYKSEQDIILLESWVEDVSVLDIIYPYGNVQYIGNDTNGLSNISEGTFVGADTYSLYGDWQADGSLIGKGYIWSELTNEEKLTFASNNVNNMYMDGDKWMQARYRIKSVHGIGNDWHNVDYYNDDANQSQSVYTDTEYSTLSIQADMLVANDLTFPYNNNPAYVGSRYSDTKGVYGINNETRARAIPIALIQRRNKGLYHELFNPSGSARTYENGTMKEWFEVTNDYITSTEDCFNPTKIAVYNPDTSTATTLEDLNNGTVTDDYKLTGTLVSGKSGRPDGLYADIIDRKDVQDLRMNANNKSLDKINLEIYNKLKNNEYPIQNNDSTVITLSKKYGEVTSLSNIGGDGDHVDVNSPTIIVDGGTYKMWHAATEGYPDSKHIDYYTSTDGSTWVRQGTVLSKGADGDTDDNLVDTPTVIKDDNTYKMWYIGYQGYPVRRNKLHYATSTDGITWNKQGVVIDLGADGDTDDYSTYSPNVIKDGTTYKMWYSGHDGSNYRIHYATSDDGITWVKHGVVVPLGDAGETDSYHTHTPNVIKDGDVYKMWYVGSLNSSSSTSKIHYATSDDGITWTKYGAVMEHSPIMEDVDGGFITSIFVLKENNTYRGWYSCSTSAYDYKIAYCELQNVNNIPYILSDNAVITDEIGTYKNIDLDISNNSYITKSFTNSAIIGFNNIISEFTDMTLYIKVPVKNIVRVLATKKDGTIVDVNYTTSNNLSAITVTTDYTTLEYTDDTDMKNNISVKAIVNAYCKYDFPSVKGDIVFKDDNITVSGDGQFKNLMLPIINKQFTTNYNNNPYHTNLAIKEEIIEDGEVSYIQHESITDINNTTINYNNILFKLYPYMTSISSRLNFNLIYEEIPYYTTPMADMSGYTAVGPLYGHDDLGEPVGPTLYKYGVVIDLGADGESDDTHVHNPNVIKDGTTYKMWYTGYDGNNRRIHYATSDDGITWTKYGVVVPLGSSGESDDAEVNYPNVIKDGTTYKMWYTGMDGSHARIHYATSDDGITWTKHGVVVPLGANRESDDYHTYIPNVIIDDTVYKMWYTGHNSSYTSICYATSDDGITWTKHGVVLSKGASGESDDYYIYFSPVIKDGDTYKMWYTGYDGSNNRIHYATSTDGVTWTKHGVVVPLGDTGDTDGKGVSGITIIKDDDTYKMWYSGSDGTNHRIHYATTEFTDPNATPSGFIYDDNIDVAPDFNKYPTGEDVYFYGGTMSIPTPYFKK